MNKEQTRAALAYSRAELHRLRPCSDWLADLIIGMRESGRFTYNADVKRTAAQQLGGELTPGEDQSLGTLVYFAQKYASEIMLARAGFVRATQEALAPFEGKYVVATQNGSLSGERTCKVKRDGTGTLVLMLLGARTRCLAAHADNWIKGLSGPRHGSAAQQGPTAIIQRGGAT